MQLSCNSLKGGFIVNSIFKKNIYILSIRKTSPYVSNNIFKQHLFVKPEIYKFCLLHFFFLYCLYYATRLTFAFFCTIYAWRCNVSSDIRKEESINPEIYLTFGAALFNVGEYSIINTLHVVIFLNMEHMKINIRWCALKCR